MKKGLILMTAMVVLISAFLSTVTKAEYILNPEDQYDAEAWLCTTAIDQKDIAFVEKSINIITNNFYTEKDYSEALGYAKAFRQFKNLLEKGYDGPAIAPTSSLKGLLERMSFGDVVWIFYEGSEKNGVIVSLTDSYFFLLPIEATGGEGERIVGEAKGKVKYFQSNNFDKTYKEILKIMGPSAGKSWEIYKATELDNVIDCFDEKYGEIPYLPARLTFRRCSSYFGTSCRCPN